MIVMMGPSPTPEQMPIAQAQGFPLSQTQMIAIAIIAVAYFQRANLGRNGLMAAAVIAAGLLLNERRQKSSGYCPGCRK